MDVARLPRGAVPTRLGVARGCAYTVAAQVEYWMDAGAGRTAQNIEAHRQKVREMGLHSHVEGNSSSDS